MSEVQLPSTTKSLVEQLDDIIGAYDSSADAETIAGFLIEFLETFGDEDGVEDIIDSLEDSGNVDGSLQSSLETEFDSSDMEVTAEEAVSILEKLCGIEWDDSLDELDDDTEDYSLF